MFRSSQGSVFVLGALGSAPRFVGCVDMDTLTEPGGAIDTLIRCFDPDTGGWKILDYILSAPDPVTTTFTMPIGSGSNPDRLFDDAPFGLLITERDGGRVDFDGNYDRAWVIGLAHAVLSGGNVLQREGNEASELTVEITGLPPVTRVTAWDKATRAVDITAVAFLGDVGLLATYDDLRYTRDGGNTWRQVSRPFVVSHVGVIQAGRAAYRLFAVRAATTGAALQLAYSDDWGITWVTVTVGSVSGQGAGGLSFGRPTSLWIAADGGYLYRSVNGGVDWAAVHSGLYTASDLNAVAFADDLTGYAVGDGDKILSTRDGGATWALAATGTGDNLTSVSLLSTLALVGTSGGKLFIGDEAAVFTQVANLGAAVVDATFVGHSSRVLGAVTAAGFWLSVNGGYSWRRLATGTYRGLAMTRNPLRFWLAGSALAALGVESLPALLGLASSFTGSTWATDGNGRAYNTPTLGAELLSNTTFASDTAWDKGTGWTISGGVAAKSAGSASYITQNKSVLGTWYRHAFDIASISAGALIAICGGFGTAPSRTAVGSYAITLRALGGNFDGIYDEAGTAVATVDNASLKALTLSTLFATVVGATSAQTAAAKIVALTTGTQAGVVALLDNIEAPANFLIAYHDGTTVKLDKCVGGTYTNLRNVTVAFSSGAQIEIRRPSGNTFQLWYGGTQRGSNVTISDAGIISNRRYGLFSTDPQNLLIEFSIDDILTALVFPDSTVQVFNFNFGQARNSFYLAM